ncbi:sensor histidine kinase [Marinilabilia rubra]|uniref:sensor histidine kinase n=1 Tax=Marinilabilia rubra TaxID=2162893 RepID=UPI001E4C7AA6|nr:hybrid sensor histidine kinase/response regulator [Marinilabilia rubra]
MHFENLSRANGLVQSNISSITCDHRGFVWFGSSDGLYEWDGLSLSIYTSEKGDSLSLSDDNISCLHPDPNQKGLWIGTVFGGINYFDYDKKEFHSFLPSINNENGVKNYLNNIRSLCKINDSTLLIGTKAQGLIKLIIKGKKIKSLERISTSADELNFRVYKIKKINTQIFVGSSRGLLILTEEGKLTEHYSPFTFSKNSRTLFKDFTTLPSGQIVLASVNNLWYWNQKNNSASILAMDESISNITCLSTDHKGRLWIGTISEGLYSFDTKKRKLRHYTSDYQNTHNSGLINNQVNDLVFYKHQPFLMIATPTGISSIDFNRYLFKSYDIQKLSEASNTSVFFQLKHPDNTRWFWTLDGLYRQSQPDQEFQKVLHSDIGKRVNLINKGIVENRTIWFATSNGLLEMRENQKMGKWHFFEHPDLPAKKLNDFGSLKADENGMIWLASRAGLVVFDTTDNNYTVYPFPLNEWGLDIVPVTDLVLTNNREACWIGSKSEFLIKFDRKTKEYYQVPAWVEATDSTRHSKANYVLSMVTDEDNRLWLATYGNGLLYMNPDSPQLQDVFAKSTLAGNTYALTFGSDSSLWISTDYGITQLNPKTEKMMEFGLDEGTFCQEFNEGAVFQTSEGEILMGGMNGFIEFDPHKIKLNKYIPPVYITSYSIGSSNVTIGGQVLRDVESVKSKEIEIPYGKDIISFEASVLNFSHPLKNQISWKLEGFDEKWSNAPSYHVITYSNLPPGNYRLRVRGANNHEVWNSEGDYLDIIVKAPFHLQPWFPWLIGGLILVLIVLVYWLQTRLLQRQKTLLSKMVRERTKSLQEAYSELKKSQQKVMVQNQELEMHRHDLKKLVAERTADLEKAKKKAEESDRLKTAFLANLSHEIRTPMNAIVGFSTLLSNIDLSDEDKDEFVKMIQQSGDNLLALINDIIDISRVETGQMILHKEEFILGPFLQEIIKTLKMQPQKKSQVSINLDVPEHLFNQPLKTDKQRLNQVITNLMGNGMKFTADGQVKLSLEALKGSELLSFIPWFEVESIPEDVLLFIVEDTGIGISEKNQKNIFQPFSRVENSGESIYGGMGLGLSIVKSILPPLGGDITLKSRQGEGTTFYFYLPVNNNLPDS